MSKIEKELLVELEILRNEIIVLKQTCEQGGAKQSDSEFHFTECNDAYKTIFEDAGDAIIIHNEKGRLLAVNKMACELLGYSFEELINLPLSEIDTSKEATYYPDRMAEMPANEKNKYETLYRSKNDILIPIEVNSTIIHWIGNTAILSICRDISERKRMEGKVINDENCLRNLLNIIRYDTDSMPEFLDLALKKAIKLTNSKTGYIYKYSEERKEFTLNTWSEDAMKECSLSDKQTAYALEKTGVLGEAVLQKKPIAVNDILALHWLKEDYSEEIAHLTKFLTMPVFVENKILWIIVVANKSDDYNETDILLLNIITEVVLKYAERRKADEARRESEDKFKTLIAQMQLGLAVHEIICDENGVPVDYRFLDVNHCFEKLTGLKRDLIIGKTVLEIMPLTEKDWISKYGHVALTGEPVKFENYSRELGKYYGVVAYRPRLNEFEVIVEDITDRKLIEIELREKAVQYRNLADSGIALIWTSGTNKLCNYFNEPWLNFTGRTLIQEMGNGWTEGIHPDDFDTCLETYITSFDKRIPFEMEYRLRDANGNYKWISDFGKPNYNSSGEFIGYIGHCFDITARKLAEERLEEEKILLRSIIDNIPDQIYYKDRNSRFILCNPAVAANCGAGNPDEVIGKTDLDLFPPDLAKQYYKHEQELIASGIPLINLEEILKNKVTGEVRWSLSTKVPITDNNGNITGLIGINRDITERKLVEDEVISSVSLLNATLESTADGILVVNRNGIITRYNKKFADMWRIPEELLQRKNDKELLNYVLSQLTYPEEFMSKVKELYERCDESSYDILYLAEERVFERYSIPQKVGEEIVGRVWSFRDITVRRKVEQELELYRNHLEELVDVRTKELDAANRLLRIEIEKEKEFEMMLQKSLEKERELNEIKSRFISTTSHEFRTPLTALILSTELIKRYGSNWPEEKKNEHLDKIRNSAKYLTMLLEDILTLNRTESGEIRYKPELIDLYTFAENCLEDSRSLVTRHQKLKFNYDSKEREFYLDPKLIRFIINNLLSNAVKFSNSKGIIELNITTSDTRLIIEVTDNGIGIPASELVKIFDSFYRSKTAENIAGTGLGLAIVKRAVELHHGEITVRSEINSGTTFVVKIPKINNK